MAASGIEYVELYAQDKQAVVDYYVRSLGFAQIAESVADDHASALLRQGSVLLIVTGGREASEFVDAHGDGVFDIALTCDDVAATGEAARCAGASVITGPSGCPVVAGFGGVRHTLVPAPGQPGFRLPAGRTWLPSPTRLGSQSRLRELDHVAVCVRGGTLAAHAEFYGAGLGLDRYSSEYVTVGDQAMDSVVVRSPSGHVTFTLVAPDPDKKPGQLDAFLARNCGPGVQHLAFAVNDIMAVVGEFRALGVEFLGVPDAYYERLTDRLPGMRSEIADLQAAAVLADRDEWGYLLQLFTRSPHVRNTLFYEFIQRRGARGFGSANIRALYEAVERDRLSAK